MVPPRFLHRSLRSSCKHVGGSQYVGVPFFDMTPARRGFMLEDIARQCDEFSDMFHTRDAKNGVTSFGKRRGGRNAVYDWRRKMNASDRRIEFKSSCFLWDERCQRWFSSSQNVKTQKFDDLVLGVYAPWGLELWEYKASAFVGLSAWSQIRGGEI
ncbi:unnamed protein product [Prorocentrum cordatum]|uniref:Decapping nuclease n=1 Tax=Prorocentrum cordatum TaxID=2364126 RepID=A0ABN9WNT9_9DINO|nr:unnamed protein product [Polarella glacialis]